MVEEDRCQTVSVSKSDPIVEKGGGLLDGPTELSIAICAMELAVVVIIDEKRAMGEVSIIDPGLEELRE